MNSHIFNLMTFVAILVETTKNKEEECHILNFLLLLLLLLLLLFKIKIVSYIEFILKNHINSFNIGVNN